MHAAHHLAAPETRRRCRLVIVDGADDVSGQVTRPAPLEPVWASEAIDLITEVSPAADLVAALAAQAEEALVRAGNQ